MSANPRSHLADAAAQRANDAQARARRALAVPVRARASEDSLHTRLRAALEDNQRLRTELTCLRAELAAALARNR
jgi:hypothetical protein